MERREKKKIIMFNLMKISHAVLDTDLSDGKRGERESKKKKTEMTSRNDYPLLYSCVSKKGVVFSLICHGSYYVDELLLTRR